MVKLYDGGIYLVNGTQIVEDPAALPSACGRAVTKEEAERGTMAYSILAAHNTSGDMDHLQMRFDSLTSHDITYVGIIQTARASGMKEFPMPYVLTNCHNSLCAVGGTINEDDHMFALSAAHKYGGIYVPTNMAVIHSYNREMMSGCGRMILGSDSHTRYGALGTLSVGEGGGELAKQLVGRTYDVARPGVVAIYLTGTPRPGVGPQDVALSIIGKVYACGYVKNKVMEFVGPGVASLPIEYRNGIDVMTTETTCWSSIWVTDQRTKDYFAIHGRPEAYKELKPADVAYYDGCVYVDLSTVECTIALPMHPSYALPIRELKANARDILFECQEKANAQITGARLDLVSKVRGGDIWVDQGLVAGCSGGTFDNVCAVADILRGHSCGNGTFKMSVYPGSMPAYIQLMKNGALTDIASAGAIIRECFCGPCFGAGDTPANGEFSIRHTTRNFPNRDLHHAGVRLRQERVRQARVQRLWPPGARARAEDGPEHQGLARAAGAERGSAAEGRLLHHRSGDDHRRADPLRRNVVLPLQPAAPGGVRPQPQGSGVCGQREGRARHRGRARGGRGAAPRGHGRI